MREFDARLRGLILSGAVIALGGGAFGQEPLARPTGAQRITLEQVKRQIATASHPLNDATTEETYFKLLIAQRRLSCAELNLKILVRAATAEPNSPAIAEAKRALVTGTNKVRELTTLLDWMMGWPDDTPLELVPPDPLTENISLQQIANSLGATSSPAVLTAEENVVKARAAYRSTKLEYAPTTAAVGGYLNQNSLAVVPSDLSYGGVIATYNLFHFGKRERAVKEAQMRLEMAQVALRLTRAQVSARWKDSYFELERSRQLSRLAQTKGSSVVRLAGLISNAEDTGISTAQVKVEVDMLEADLAHRQAYAKLKAFMGACAPDTCKE